MNRRDAVQRVAYMIGGLISAPVMAGLRGQKTNMGASVLVTPEQESLLAELANVIIPDTDTPGAKAAGVEKFITRVVRDCFVKEEQDKFYAGLTRLNELSNTSYKKGFGEVTEAEKIALVEKTIVEDKPFFMRMKELTAAGYFTSEIGATKALEYLPIPGKFDGCVPMTKNQKAWAL